MEQSNKIKVAIITNGGIGGGFDNQGLPFITDLVYSLAKECEVSVFSFGTHGGIKEDNFTIKSISGSLNQPVLFKVIKMLRLVWKAQKEQQFDIFHGFWPFPSGFVSVLLGKIFKVKTIVSLQGGGLANIPEINYGGNRNWIKRQLNNWTIKNVDRITTLTKFLESLIPDASLKEKNSVIYYGVNTTKFKYIEKKIGLPVQFIHVANINEVKDQTTLIKAFEIISKQIDCHLRIAGPDVLSGRIHLLVQELRLGNKIEFLGFVNHHEVPKLLENADLMLHSSLHEGMGVVLAEAMASGVLVCGTNVGLIADLSPECCIGVSVKDYEKLANEVLELLKDEPRMNKMRKNSYTWINENSHVKCVMDFKSLYNQLITTSV